jgi:hypothetical protein
VFPSHRAGGGADQQVGDASARQHPRELCISPLDSNKLALLRANMLVLSRSNGRRADADQDGRVDHGLLEGVRHAEAGQGGRHAGIHSGHAGEVECQSRVGRGQFSPRRTSGVVPAGSPEMQSVIWPVMAVMHSGMLVM